MIIVGDCAVELQKLEANSVDAVVTDPPYGLKFMGKKWDYDVPSTDIWREVLRVLKPGGHLLSFGGTRTYHRMVVAIEDAGFEIRDQIQWLYGSGFPKSHDISKAIDKQAGAEREVVGQPDGSQSITAPATPEAKQWQGWGTALKPSHEDLVLARKPLTDEGSLTSLALEICQHKLFANVVQILLKSNSGVHQPLNIAQWIAGENTLTLDDLSALTAMSQSALDQGLNLSIEFSWLNILAAISKSASMFTTEMASSLTIDLKILKSLLLKNTQDSIPSQDRHGEKLDASHVADLFNALIPKLDYILTLFAQDLATSKVDLSNLRPNNEPIVLARKPLEHGLTIAQNVLKWGTGGLNIDASRVGTEVIYQHQRDLSQAHGNNWAAGTKQPVTGVTNSTIGRFPANLLLDETAAEMLDEQVKGRMPQPAGNKNPSKIGHGKNVKFNDSIEKVDASRFQLGGDPEKASRFFYCAKASKSERNAGLEGMPERESGIKNDSGRGFSEGDPYKKVLNQNHHPTVKPLKLMEYLIRLVTPPNGTVLDPFMGSGTTGVACKQLGFEFIGIEMNLEYAEIAEKRIEATP